MVPIIDDNKDTKQRDIKNTPIKQLLAIILMLVLLITSVFVLDKIVVWLYINTSESIASVVIFILYLVLIFVLSALWSYGLMGGLIIEAYKQFKMKGKQ